MNSENLREGEDTMVGENMDIMNMMNMENMTMSNDLILSQSFIVNILSGFWGQVILLLSFGIMLARIWFIGSKKIMVIVITGVIVLYISMYKYYSINLEIIGM